MGQAWANSTLLICDTQQDLSCDEHMFINSSITVIEMCINQHVLCCRWYASAMGWNQKTPWTVCCSIKRRIEMRHFSSSEKRLQQNRSLYKYIGSGGCSDNWNLCISETKLFVQRIQANYLVLFLQVSPMLPETFLERHIRVYVKEKKHEKAATEWVHIVNFCFASTR